VGVGQSEITVSEMVDFFLVLMLAGGGDELQGIKKGVLEVADMIAITKADGDNTARAKVAATDYQHALRIITPASAAWMPPVVTVSSLENRGLEALWEKIRLHRDMTESSGARETRRKKQMIRWMWAMVEDQLIGNLKSAPAVKDAIPKIEQDIGLGLKTPTMAAKEILETFGVAGRE
jgi:LAO/AO transport system kinase